MWRLLFIPFLVVCVIPSGWAAEEPLHVRIDQHVTAGQVGPQADLAGDGEFIRRLYLDLLGRIPSSAEARAFIDDKAAGKRTAAVDRLLASPGYARNMAGVFDVMLMERRADKHVKGPEWRGYLQDAFAANRPWDQLAAEIIAADGNSTEIPRAAAKFILDRNAEPNLVTRDLGRKFFGMDLQCAQCHDHPNVADYYQRDYYGLFAFVNRSYVFQPDTKKPAVLAEKAAGQANFKSVFTDVAGGTRPRVPAGLEIAEPVFAPGNEWTVVPNPKDKNLRGIPKYSRRAQLAKHAATSPYFRRNIANRLWGHMMGRALVEPRDGIHSDNPAAHPALLDLLADDLAANGYDLKRFIRELALSQTYQRRFDLPGDLKSHAELAALDAEQKKKSAAVETAQVAFDAALVQLDTARGERFTLKAELDKTLKPVADAKKVHDTAAAAQTGAAQKLAAKKTAHEKVAALARNAQAVAAEYKDDKELAGPATQLKAKADKLAGELAALQKDYDTKAAATQTAADKLAAAQKPRDAAQAKWAEADARVQAADQAWQITARARETAKHAESLAFRRLEDSQAIVQLNQAQAILAQAQTQVDKVAREYSAARKELEPFLARLAKVASPQIKAREAHAAAMNQSTAAREALAVHEARLKEGAAALTAARESLKLLQEAQAVSTNTFLKTQTALTGPLSASLDQARASVTGMQSVQVILEQNLTMARLAVTETSAAVQRSRIVLDQANAALAVEDKKVEPTRAKEQAAAQRLAVAQREAGEAKAAVNAAADQLGQRWSKNFGVGAFTHLTPEQLCWSMLQASDQVAVQRTAGEADYDKKNPLAKDAQPDTARLQARSLHADQFAHDKLLGNTTIFVRLFGGAAGEVQTDFYATADQALYFANGGTVRSWLGRLASRLGQLEDPNGLAEELYLTVLTRRPDPAEAKAVEAYLSVPAEKRTEAIREMAWGLMTSTEFRFKH